MEYFIELELELQQHEKTKRFFGYHTKKTDYAMPRSIHTAYRMNFQLITLTCKEIKNKSDLCFYYCAANITTHLNVQTAEDNVVSRRI